MYTYGIRYDHEATNPRSRSGSILQKLWKPRTFVSVASLWNFAFCPRNLGEICVAQSKTLSPDNENLALTGRRILGLEGIPSRREKSSLQTDTDSATAPSGVPEKKEPSYCYRVKIDAIYFPCIYTVRCTRERLRYVINIYARVD